MARASVNVYYDLLIDSMHLVIHVIAANLPFSIYSTYLWLLIFILILINYGVLCVFVYHKVDKIDYQRVDTFPTHNNMGRRPYRYITNGYGWGQYYN